MKFQTKRIGQQIVVLTILVTAYLLPRAGAIGKFVAVDEVNWLHRSGLFYDALVKRDWSGTYTNNSPGVVTSWVGALAFKFAAPSFSIPQDSQYLEEKNKTSYSTFQNELVWKVGVQPLYVLAISRVIMILLLLAVLLGSYYFAQRLFGVWPSLIGFLIIALDPFIIALTRMSHLDAPQAFFMFLSLLAFMSFVFRGSRWFDLIISGIAGGLAFLSKLPGVFIIPTIGVIALWEIYRTRVKLKPGQAIFTNPNLRVLLRALLIWGLVFLITYAALWPSMWVRPVRTIQNILGTTTKYSNTIIDESTNVQDDDIDTVATRSFLDYFRYPESFLWRTTPIVLLGLVLLLVTNILGKERGFEKPASDGVIGLLVLVVVYTIGMTLPAKSSEKYYAPVHLVLDFLAGLGWYFFSVNLAKRFKESQRLIISSVVLIAAIAIQSIWVAQSFPYFFTFYNPLLGGLHKAAQVSFIGVGEGLDQAGLYLNSKPDSSKLNVLAWYGTGPVSYFFDGHVFPLYLSNSTWTPELRQKLKQMDYLVIYTNQKFRNQPPELFKILSGISPEYTVMLKGTEYAWVYKVSKLSLPQN